MTGHENSDADDFDRADRTKHERLMGMSSRDMTDSIVFFLVADSAAAQEEIDALADTWAHRRGKVNMPEITTLRSALSELVAKCIWSAIDWNIELEPRVAGDARGRIPSRMRLEVIRQLQEIAEFASVDRRAKSAPVLPEVMDLLLSRRSPLGEAVLIPVAADGGEPSVDRQIFLSGDLSGAVRHLKRLQASSHEPVAFGGLPTIPALPPDIIAAFDAAEHTTNSSSPSLKAVKEALAPQQRRLVADFAAEAANALTREFGIDPVTDNQSTETLASWERPRPLEQFVVAVFESFVPICGMPFEEIVLSGASGEDGLGAVVRELAEESTFSARKILESIQPLLAKNGFRIAPETLHDPFDSDEDDDLQQAARGIHRHYLEPDSSIVQLSEDKIGAPDRLRVGRRRLVGRLWRLRNDIVILRGFGEFFHWTAKRLSTDLAEDTALADQFRDVVVNRVTDWYRELLARYEEGFIDTTSPPTLPSKGQRDRHKRARARHIGGVPRNVPDVPMLARTRRLYKHQYVGPDPNARTWGLRRDDDIVDALLQAIESPDDIETPLQIWRRATGALEGPALG